MILTSQQLTTLKAAINADGPMLAMWNARQADAIAAAFNAASSFIVWRTSVPVEEINDAIVWASLTPLDAVPTSDALAVSIWQARATVCQSKQTNLQLILGTRGAVPGNRTSIRTGLQDALTAIPSGAGGAPLVAGWPAVRSVLQRPATVGERIFATGTGSAATPGQLVTEGDISVGDILAAMGN